jgi:hypothetical protein
MRSMALPPVLSCVIQLVSTYVESHSERGACSRAATSAALVPSSTMRAPPPVASGYQCRSSPSTRRLPAFASAAFI